MSVLAFLGHIWLSSARLPGALRSEYTLGTFCEKVMGKDICVPSLGSMVARDRLLARTICDTHNWESEKFGTAEEKTIIVVLMELMSSNCEK